MVCPFLLKGQDVYFFLSTVRFLEVALKNVFVPVNDLRKTLPQFYSLKKCSFANKIYQFSRSVVSDSLWPHESQHTRPPCPSPTPGIHPNSCPSSQWCHLAILSSVDPFSSCPQSLPASGSFPVSQLFTWGDQSIGVSALASFLPKITQGWPPLEWTGWIKPGLKSWVTVSLYWGFKALIYKLCDFRWIIYPLSLSSLSYKENLIFL